MPLAGALPDFRVSPLLLLSSRFAEARVSLDTRAKTTLIFVAWVLQVRPLIKLGFNEARLVWIEAQRVGARRGKLVTGEMVADIVNRLKKEDLKLEHHGTLRQGTTTGAKLGCGSPSSVHSEPTAAARMPVTDVQLGESCQASVDGMLLLADFEALRSRANALADGEKQRILQKVTIFALTSVNEVILRDCSYLAAFIIDFYQ